MSEPPNTVEILPAVLPKLDLSLSTHFWRSGAMAPGSGMSMGMTNALPISEPPEAGAAGIGRANGGVAGVAPTSAGAEVAAGSVVEVVEGCGGAGGFFLKKLNMCWVLGMTAFYETALLHPLYGHS